MGVLVQALRQRRVAVDLFGVDLGELPVHDAHQTRRDNRRILHRGARRRLQAGSRSLQEVGHLAEARRRGIHPRMEGRESVRGQPGHARADVVEHGAGIALERTHRTELEREAVEPVGEDVRIERGVVAPDIGSVVRVIVRALLRDDPQRLRARHVLGRELRLGRLGGIAPAIVEPVISTGGRRLRRIRENRVDATIDRRTKARFVPRRRRGLVGGPCGLDRLRHGRRRKLQRRLGGTCRDHRRDETKEATDGFPFFTSLDAFRFFPVPVQCRKRNRLIFGRIRRIAPAAVLLVDRASRRGRSGA